MRWKNITIPIAVIFLFAVLEAIFFPPYLGEWDQAVFIDSIFYEYLPIIILSSLLLFGLSRKLRFRKANLSYAATVGPPLVFLLDTFGLLIFPILWDYHITVEVGTVAFSSNLLEFPLAFCIISSVSIKYIYREKWKKAIISGIIFGIVTLLLFGGFKFLIYLMHGIPG